MIRSRAGRQLLQLSPWAVFTPPYLMHLHWGQTGFCPLWSWACSYRMSCIITLAGIAARNGILKVSHYLNLALYEGENFGQDLVVRGKISEKRAIQSFNACALN